MRVRANVPDQLRHLDNEIANADAFRALLKEVNGRMPLANLGTHLVTITAVRAGLLRALIFSVMACLDQAGIGRLLDQLANLKVPNIQSIRDDYNRLRDSQLLRDAKRLRDKLAHLSTDRIGPEVAYETFYKLLEATEQLAASIFAACNERPHFCSIKDSSAMTAKVFWDTYFDGTGRHNS
jgi:hypothetical protein